MHTRLDYLKRLTGDIVKAADDKDWASVQADLSVLAGQLAGALHEREGDGLRAVYGIVEAAYSTIITKYGLHDEVRDVQGLAGELQACTRIFAVAMQFPERTKEEELLGDSKFKHLLLALGHARYGLSGRELAKAVGQEPETIARKLPILRSYKLIHSQQVGKATINTLTPKAVELMDRRYGNWQRLPAEAAA